MITVGDAISSTTSNRKNTFLVCDIFDLVMICGLETDYNWHIQKWKGTKKAAVVFQIAKTFLLVLNANYNLLEVLVEFLPHLLPKVIKYLLT